MPGIKQSIPKSTFGRMALASGLGKSFALKSESVPVAALFDFAVERQLVRQKAGWFEFGECRLGRSRTQAVQFLKRNVLVATSLQKSVLNSVLKPKEPGVAVFPRKIRRSRSAVPLAKRESSSEGPKESTRNDAINQLYADLATLTSQQLRRPKDAKLRHQVSSKLSQLRDLQEAEAAMIQQRFLGSLSVPLGTLQNLLKPTPELSDRDEDSSAADDPPHVAD